MGVTNGNGNGWRSWAISILGAIMMLMLGAFVAEQMESDDLGYLRTRQAEHEAMAAHPVSLEAQTAYRRESDRRFAQIEEGMRRMDQKLDLLLQRSRSDGGGGG